jgi:hypothetical protein
MHLAWVRGTVRSLRAYIRAVIQSGVNKLRKSNEQKYYHGIFKRSRLMFHEEFNALRETISIKLIR